jgi:hypothetical protein
MATKVVNAGRVPLQVGIILANGAKTSIRVMGRGRPELPEGAKVDPNWMALNGQDVRVFEDKSINVAEQVSQSAKNDDSTDTQPKTETTTPSATPQSDVKTTVSTATEKSTGTETSAKTVDAEEKTQ